MKNYLNSDNYNQGDVSFHRYGVMYYSHNSKKYEMYLTNDQEDQIDFIINTTNIVWGTWEFQDQREFEQTLEEIKRINNNTLPNRHHPKK